MKINEITENISTSWKDIFWYEDSLSDDVKQFIETSPAKNISMGCQDESECWASRLKKQFPDAYIELVGGMFSQDDESGFEEGHTWVTIDDSIFDPTAAQFDCYPNIDSNQYTPHEVTEIE